MKHYKVVSSAVTFGKFNKEPVERLEDFGCEVQLNPFGRPFTPEEFQRLAGDADAIIVGNDKVTADVINSLSQAKIIAKHGVGIDGIDVETAHTAGIAVTNAPGTNKEEVADAAMGFMLLLARDLNHLSQATKTGAWDKYPTHSLANKTMGIIGAGNIGTAFAKRARGFGMTVLVSDPVQREAVKQLGAVYAAFDEVLRHADYISIHCPLTASTYRLLGQEEFQQMKPGVFLVNTARSQIVDEKALYSFVKSRKIAGYGTDVFDVEPPVMLPLYQLPNVYLTPHVAGTTYDSNLRMGNRTVDNVLAVFAEHVPPNLIVQEEIDEDNRY